MSVLCEIVKYLPIALCVITPISIFITYGMAVANHHVHPLWPYISDTGTKPPESCVFSLLLNLVAYLLCSIIYLKYREVSEYIKIKTTVRITPSLNRTAAVLGFISCLGLDIVANFQESNQFWVHIIGAFMCFFSGAFYFIFQTVFTYKMHPEAKLILWIRIVFTSLNVMFIVGTFAPIKSALTEFKGKDPLLWSEKDGGFGYHITSTFCEWFLVFSFCAYVSTLIWDFRKLTIIPPQITFNERDENNGSERGNKQSMWI